MTILWTPSVWQTLSIIFIGMKNKAKENKNLPNPELSDNQPTKKK
jgi:hypothetical protein